MTISEGRDLTELIESPRTAEARRHFHAVDITERAWTRMRELGLSEGDLADRLGVSEAELSDMLSVQGDMTLQGISEIEEALGTSLIG